MIGGPRLRLSSLNVDDDTGPWTVEEMNLLADEAEELIAQTEADERESEE
jgi:hypothetical protein